jgi:hypothetical protein
MSSINNGAGQIMSSITSAGLLTIPSVSATTMTVSGAVTAGSLVVSGGTISVAAATNPTMLYVNTNASVSGGSKGYVNDPYPTLAAAMSEVVNGDIIQLQTDIDERISMVDSTLWSTQLTIIIPRGITWYNTLSDGVMFAADTLSGTIDIYCYGSMHKTTTGSMMTSGPMLLNLYGGGTGTLASTSPILGSDRIFELVNIVDGFLDINASGDILVDYTSTGDVIFRNIRRIRVGAAIYNAFIYGGSGTFIMENINMLESTTTTTGSLFRLDVGGPSFVRNVNMVHRCTNTGNTGSLVYGYAVMHFENCTFSVPTGVKTIRMGAAPSSGSTFRNCSFTSSTYPFSRGSTAYLVESYFCRTIGSSGGMDSSSTGHSQHCNVNVDDNDTVVSDIYLQGAVRSSLTSRPVTSYPNESTVSGTVTLTTTQVRSGILYNTSGTATWTLPTDAAMVAAVTGAEVGDMIKFNVIHESSGTLTINGGGPGGTHGASTLSANTSAGFGLRFDNVTSASESATLYRLS